MIFHPPEADPNFRMSNIFSSYLKAGIKKHNVSSFAFPESDRTIKRTQTN